MLQASRVLGHEPQGLLFAATTDEDRDPPGPDRPRPVQGGRDGVVAPGEAGSLLREHGPADLERLFEALHALGDWREAEAVTCVLVVVPSRADAENGPTRGDDVESCHDLGQVGRVAVGDAGHHRAEAGALGPGGDRSEEGVGLEHRVCARPDARDLVEVVHHPHRVEAGLLGGHRDLGDTLEELPVRDAGECEIRDL